MIYLGVCEELHFWEHADFRFDNWDGRRYNSGRWSRSDCFILTSAHHKLRGSFLVIIRWMIFLLFPFFPLRKENCTWIAVFSLRFYSTMEDSCLFCLKNEWHRLRYISVHWLHVQSLYLRDTQFSNNRDNVFFKKSADIISKTQVSPHL